MAPVARPLLCSLAALAGLLTLSSPARADSPLDFTLKNRLGVPITHVYISPHQATVWEEDVLGKGTLADNQETRIRFGNGQSDRGDIWDLKIRTADNREYVWREPGFNLRKISEITLILKDGKATALWK